MQKAVVVGVVGFVLGATVASAAWSTLPEKRAESRSHGDASTENRDDDLKKANANLTQSLQECDRRLAELGESRPVMPPPQVVADEGARDAGRWRRRGGAEPTKDDWEKMADTGVIRTRVPCIRDTPWSPSQRAVDRLGLAPGDAETLKEAYAHSNKRVADQVRPLCAKALGSAEVADKVGTNACVDAIASGARKASAADMKSAISRVAEVQAGKREAPRDGADVAAIEKLGLILTQESKEFESELAKKLGPEEAKRLAWAPELCTDRRVLRSSDNDDRFDR